MTTSIEPFRIAATDDQLDDLKRRLRATRWPERECVDAMMGFEALVLICKQQVEKTRINIFGTGGQSPPSLGCRIGAQQLAVAVEHRGRVRESLPERR